MDSGLEDCLVHSLGCLQRIRDVNMAGLLVFLQDLSNKFPLVLNKCVRLQMGLMSKKPTDASLCSSWQRAKGGAPLACMWCAQGFWPSWLKLAACILQVFSTILTVDGQNPAPPKKPWNGLICQYRQPVVSHGFSGGANGFRVHSSILALVPA